MTATDHAVELVVAAARAASDKLAQQIIAFDVSEQLAITDAFLLASASNDRQVRSIVDEVEDKLREIGAKPIRREGERDGRWVLIDYGEIVVHVQHEEERQFYALERLWRDCPTIPLPADVTAHADRVVDLVLLRHGRTDWNAARRIQGQADSQLDDLGHAQAEAVAPVLAALAPAAVWSSDSDRARSTASYVASALRPHADLRRPAARVLPRPPRGAAPPRVRGRGPGGVRRVRPRQLGRRPRRREARRGRRPHDRRAHRGRRPPYPSDGVALVVSHGAAIRTAVAALLGWPSEDALTLRGMDNCGWAVLRRRTPDEPWRLRRLQPHRAARFRVRPACWLGFRELSAGLPPSGNTWGCGAAGSASAWHAEGQGFESPQLHSRHAPPAKRAALEPGVLSRVEGADSAVLTVPARAARPCGRAPCRRSRSATDAGGETHVAANPGFSLDMPAAGAGW